MALWSNRHVKLYLSSVQIQKDRRQIKIRGKIISLIAISASVFVQPVEVECNWSIVFFYCQLVVVKPPLGS